MSLALTIRTGSWVSSGCPEPPLPAPRTGRTLGIVKTVPGAPLLPGPLSFSFQSSRGGRQRHSLRPCTESFCPLEHLRIEPVRVGQYRFVMSCPAEESVLATLPHPVPRCKRRRTREGREFPRDGDVRVLRGPYPVCGSFTPSAQGTGRGLRPEDSPVKKSVF